MYDYKVWLLDLDDTLQVGPLSWAAVNVLPEMARQLDRPLDPMRFEEGYARAQDLFNAGADDSMLAEALFRALDWPLALLPTVIERFHRDYRPALFDDTLAFLDNLTTRGCALYILSNNKHAPYVVDALRLGQYFTEILTPKTCGVTGKPTPALWHSLQTRTGFTAAETVVVGNNLRTDGAFSKNCGLDCIIVDRYNRYAAASGAHRIVRSLHEIVTDPQ